MKEFEVNKIYLLQSGYKHRQNTPAKIIKKTKKFIIFEFCDKHTMSGIDCIKKIKISFSDTKNKQISKNNSFGYLDSTILS